MAPRVVAIVFSDQDVEIVRPGSAFSCSKQLSALGMRRLNAFGVQATVVLRMTASIREQANDRPSVRAMARAEPEQGSISYRAGPPFFDCKSRRQN